MAMFDDGAGLFGDGLALAGVGVKKGTRRVFDSEPDAAFTGFWKDPQARDRFANEKGLWHMRFSTGNWYCCANDRKYKKWHNDWKARDKW
eukprot:CAMPEP_0201588144 /NCGR_PEP_ID=MMETSP0190_2-20130828/151918_1 /ASSEMBLY_ACC=CAM_ASM_000263 /TAXON_ID=37353 /ORGANISM="Rosalina sp." /LENGTH=89 /DNA_ID=CAMNT_0048039719 /DNA_START=160 /DNA_END=426 /DNA_ORIENTATION=-